jgi:chitinase
MRTTRTAAAVLSLAVVLCGAELPDRLFAPYIDVSQEPHDLLEISRASGVKFFSLAFIVDGGQCQASWFGKGPLAQERTLAPMIAGLRALGGDVIVSFGGAEGSELARNCQTAAALAQQYQAVIDRYRLTMVDLDIEGGSLADHRVVDRRNAALASIQAANAGLRVSYTLPVLPGGLGQDTLNLLKNAESRGVTVRVVNLMAMDYGPSADPKAMGQNAISAARNTIAQLRANGLSAAVGIIPMIGLNDTRPEVTTTKDARQILEWALGNPGVGRMSMWSVGRDRSCPGGLAVVSPTCSGVAQREWEFSEIFRTFR